MRSDAATIRKLSLRSNLPRLSKQETYLFAVLDKEELALPERAKALLIADEFMRRAFMPLYLEDEVQPTFALRAYRFFQEDPDYTELWLGFDVTATKRPVVCGHVRMYRGTFLYFVGSSTRTLSSLPEAAWTHVGEP